VVGYLGFGGPSCLHLQDHTQKTSTCRLYF